MLKGFHTCLSLSIGQMSQWNQTRNTHIRLKSGSILNFVKMREINVFPGSFRTFCSSEIMKPHVGKISRFVSVASFCLFDSQ